MIETKSQKSFGANAYVNRSYSWKTGRKGGEEGGSFSGWNPDWFCDIKYIAFKFIDYILGHTTTFQE